MRGLLDFYLELAIKGRVLKQFYFGKTKLVRSMKVIWFIHLPYHLLSSTTMPPKVVPTPPFFQRVVVGTLAVLAGAYVLKDAGKDLEFVKFEPHTPEEIERRKRDGVHMTMKTLETRSLNYTPEAQERLRKLIEEKEQKEKKLQSEEKKET